MNSTTKTGSKKKKNLILVNTFCVLVVNVTCVDPQPLEVKCCILLVYINQCTERIETRNDIS